MKQTAVEWVFQELDNYYQMKSTKSKKEILDQAKEIEEQQIIDACIYGQNNHTVFITADMEIAEQYYNETFNK